MGARIVPYNPDRPRAFPNAPSPEQTEDRLRDLEIRVQELEIEMANRRERRCVCRRSRRPAPPLPRPAAASFLGTALMVLPGPRAHSTHIQEDGRNC